jgi:hypothetical protein
MAGRITVSLEIVVKSLDGHTFGLVHGTVPGFQQYIRKRTTYPTASGSILWVGASDGTLYRRFNVWSMLDGSGARYLQGVGGRAGVDAVVLNEICSNLLSAFNFLSSSIISCQNKTLEAQEDVSYRSECITNSEIRARDMQPSKSL